MTTLFAKQFSGPINQIAVNQRLISPEQQKQVLDMQAKFAALADKGVKPTARFLDSDPLLNKVKDNWSELAEQYSITENDLAKRLEDVNSGKELKKEEAPASGDIAAALKFIDKDVKNALLTAQAAVRTEEVLNNISNPESRAPSLSQEEINQRFDRIDIARDPAPLVDAQLANRDAEQMRLEITTLKNTNVDDANHPNHKESKSRSAQLPELYSGAASLMEAAADKQGNESIKEQLMQLKTGLQEEAVRSANDSLQKLNASQDEGMTRSVAEKITGIKLHDGRKAEKLGIDKEYGIKWVDYVKNDKDNTKGAMIEL